MGINPTKGGAITGVASGLANLIHAVHCETLMNLHKVMTADHIRLNN